METRRFNNEKPDQGKLAPVSEVTVQMLEIIVDGGMREPDVITPGPEPYEVSFIWEAEKLITIIDRREEPESP